MRVVTGTTMRAADAWAISGGLPETALMYAAGRAVAAAARLWLRRRGRWPGRVLVVCGRGNNGGDGLVAALALANWGAEVEAVVCAEPEALAPAARLYWEAARAAGCAVEAQPQPDARALAARAQAADVVVDALLGTGVRGAPRPPVEAVIGALEAAGRPVIAVDVPSGLDADTGRAAGAAVAAVETVALGAAKLGCLTGPDHWRAGRVRVADIGIPDAAYEAEEVRATAPFHPITAWGLKEAAGALPQRRPTGHKGTFGRVFILAGATGMSGAAALAARAALRAGCGLVEVLVPEPVWPIVAALVPEALVHPAPADASGGLAAEAGEAAAALAGRADVVLAGPGLGRAPGAAAALAHFLSAFRGPLVLDADALALVEAAALRRREAPVALTPHAGELARLLGLTPEAVEADRLAALHRAVAASGAAVVLKGAGSLTGAPDGRAWVNLTGNDGLATAGAGDVLAGLTAGLWAQAAAAGQLDGRRAPELLAAAVWLHGRAGDLAAARLGRRALTAGELVRHLAAALREAER
ncbi:MAG: NAD(P)H-hydrate dehydratase [Firmicutes bacterium]|nr:NAD(P)H-hydrate dehydratase [Bacillota bacterium]